MYSKFHLYIVRLMTQFRRLNCTTHKGHHLPLTFAHLYAQNLCNGYPESIVQPAYGTEKISVHRLHRFRAYTNPSKRGKFLHSHHGWEGIGFMWKNTFEIFIKSLRFETPWVRKNDWAEVCDVSCDEFFFFFFLRRMTNKTVKNLQNSNFWQKYMF